ncbi:MAG: SidA/IucD/PvdA family monooxygenase [Solirubrobacteraceae bacterium]|nr:SidA/IucD/PvdA family monooxygenase [Solirubrobacteraceae bacterium]
MSFSVPARSDPADGVFDIVGVGFGPSNLALAVALAEHNESASPAERLSARFVERQQVFGWHRGMLLDDATMQVSFLKDLVTMRNPASCFSFVSYLHHRDRMADFINYGSVFPTRLEFHDYLEWVAAAFADHTDYGAEVTGIEPVETDGSVRCVDVVVDERDGTASRLRTHNVVLATGLQPFLPEGVTTSARIWHNCDLLTKVGTLTAPRRLTVVGAGQSAAETVEYLHRRFPTAEVCAVFTRYGYSPADDSSFANRVFDPHAVDEFYDAPPKVKDLICGYHGNTNYSVVDPQLIDELYRCHYRERVAGRERLRFLNVSTVTDVVDAGDVAELAVQDMLDGTREVLTSDAVVFATGYRPSDPLRLLGGLAAECRRDERGQLEIRRDYRVQTSPSIETGIYVQGATEHSHGLSSTLLSNIATRSGEILGSVLAAHGAHVLAGSTSRPATA